MIKHYNIISSLFGLLFSAQIINSQTFQNLAPNGSFETYTQCPYSTGGQLYFAAHWTGPTFNSTDYYNSCSISMNVPYYAGVASVYPAYLLAKDGVAYAGLYTYFYNNTREYAQIELSDTLSEDICYYIEFYTTYFQRIKYYTNNVAASFLASSYPTNLTAPGIVLNIPMHITNYGNPIITDTVKWQKISGIYEATGIEKYIILGNFRNNSNTDTLRAYPLGSGPSLNPNNSYIFIDAVSVFSINPHGSLPWSYRDTTITKGDSVYIGNKMGGQNFNPKWYDMNGNYLATNAGIYVRPLATSSYVVQYTICGVQRVDTVEVKVLPDVGLPKNFFNFAETDIRFYPQPADEILNVELIDYKLQIADWQIEIVNSFGQIIREEEIVFKDKKTNISTKHVENGIYVLRIKSNNSVRISKRFVIGR